MSGVSVILISGNVGAEIRGVGLAGDGLDAPLPSIREASADHHALFFPGQKLTPGNLVRFVSSFGTPLVHPYLKGVPDHPEV